MTKLPATKFGIKNRGEIKNNFWADLLIFDPKKIKDNATFIDPKNGPSGVEYVFVNGKKTVVNGMILEEYAGSTIRK